MIPTALATVLGIGGLGGERSAAAEPKDASPRFRIESVRVDPPRRELEVLVRRTIRIREGQLVDAGMLVASREDLLASGYFQDAVVYTTRGSKPGDIVLVVEVDLSKRFHLETGVGHDTVGGWYLNLLGLRWTSPLRRGGEARIGMYSGTLLGGYFAELEIPEVGHPSLDLRFDLSAFQRTWVIHDDDRKYHQEIGHALLMAGLRKRFSPDFDVTWWGGILGVKPSDEIVSQDEDELEEEPGRLVPKFGDGDVDHLETRVEVLWDRRDPSRPWQSGPWVGSRLRAVHRLGGPSFAGGEIDGRLALPFAETRALALRARAGWMGHGTPYHQRFLVGGAGSLRGFDFAGLSGSLGAQAFWQGTAEFRQPLVGSDPRRPRVLGTLFVDCGDLWNAERTRHGVAANVGYGVQIRIPWIQILNLEVAHPLTEERTGSPVVLLATLGRSF